MSSELKGLITEHDSICKEIKRLTIVTSKLRKRKKELDDKIVKKLDENQEKGVKYKNELFMKKEGKSRKRKTKIERQSDCETVLRQNGINNPGKVFEQLNEAMKGHEIEVSSIKKKEPRKKKK